MNLFQLVIKQMRQRALGTTLTLLSVLLGVSLAISIMILRREGRNLFAQTDFGYDVILGPPKGSPLDLTLNTVYHLYSSPGVIPFSLYEDVARKRPLAGHPDFHYDVKQAVPYMAGDSYQNRGIVGTSPRMFGYDDDGKPISAPFQYRLGKTYELAQGRVFGLRKFEAVIGSEVAAKLNLHLADPKLTPQDNEKAGGAFRATHGFPGPKDTPDIHKPVWEVVGILKPTHTANDRILFVPYISLYAIAEHESGIIDQALLRANIDPSRIPANRLDDVLQALGIDPQKVPASVKRKFNMEEAAPAATGPATQDVGKLLQAAKVAPKPAVKDDRPDPDAYHLDANGNIVPDLPPEEWELSAILVQTHGFPDSTYQQQHLMYLFKVVDDRASAANPADVMRQFFVTFLAGSSLILLLICSLVTVVAAIGILVSIYNSVTSRRKEIAILRALGATRGRILVLICIEASFIGLIGGVLGLLLGHGLAAIGSVLLNSMLGQGINWVFVDPWELIYLVGVVVIATVAGLVPALSAYRTPVATNLVSS